MSLLSVIKNLFLPKQKLNNIQNQELRIEFLDGQMSDLEGVHFNAKVNGKTINCLITFETIQDVYHILDGEHLKGYLENRNSIHELARKRILKNPTIERVVL